MRTVSRHGLVGVGLAALILGTATRADTAYYYTVAPCRAYDSRLGTSHQGASERNVPLRSVCNVPANASGVVATVSMVPTTAAADRDGYFAVWDAGATIPRDGSNFPLGMSVVNWTNGLTALTAGTTIPFTSSNTNVKVFAGYGPTGFFHLVIDVYGYYKN